jgi:hypothetical protein
VARRRSGRLPENHFLVRGVADGWFCCACGCGYVAVCRHCHPGVSVTLPQWYCTSERKRLKIGEFAEEEASEA